MLLLFLACNPTPIEEPPPARTVVESVPLAPRLHVWASSLNLRAQADASSDIVAKLPVNSALDKVASGPDGWVQVRTQGDTPRTGWLKESYLGSEPLTVSHCLEQASGSEGDDQLGWYQRAAALSDAPEVLRALHAAYIERGMTRPAQVIAAQLEWSTDALYVPVNLGGGDVSIELDTGYYSEQEIQGLRQQTLDEIAAGRWSTDQEWWVLPEFSAAVRATPHAPEVGLVTHCPESWGATLAFDVELPEGELALAVHRGPPPATWTQARAQPALDRKSATRAVESAADARWTNRVEGIWLQAKGTGYQGTVGILTEAEMLYGLTVYDVTVAADGAVTLSKSGRDEDFGYSRVMAQRDLDGDGKAERVIDNACSVTWQTQDGDTLAGTEHYCCL